jgi:light-regulated signal transduction histidine kinase (bacteriophytochrome)
LNTWPAGSSRASSIDKRIEESRADALAVREVVRVAAVALTLTVVHRLFEPFQRLDRARVDDYHSLGLSIVRGIAIAHDATLTADARPQGASR